MRFLLPIASLLLLLGACDKKDAAAAPEPAKAAEPADAKPADATKPGDVKTANAGDAKAEARKLFDTLCVTCHGASGKGDGAAAANLNPKPRDYTDKAWQAKVTDENLAKAIVEGGPAVGLSPLMPPSPALKEKPDVVNELVAIIRSFGK